MSCIPRLDTCTLPEDAAHRIPPLQRLHPVPVRLLVLDPDALLRVWREPLADRTRQRRHEPEVVFQQLRVIVGEWGVIRGDWG